MTRAASSAPGAKEIRGVHVLAAMLAFFGVMFAVNGVFLYYAIKTHPGEQVEKSYLQGLDYNDTLAARRLQSDLGWRAEIGLTAYGGEAVLVARLFDENGRALNGLEATGNLHRKGSTTDRRGVDLEATGGGEYRARLTDLMPGRWDVIVRAGHPGSDSIAFEARKTVVAP